VQDKFLTVSLSLIARSDGHLVEQSSRQRYAGWQMPGEVWR